jgi:hypothetical protein
MLVNEMKEKNDLNSLMKNFEMWKRFMAEDMKQFEENSYLLSKVGLTEAYSPSPRKSRHRSFDFSRSSSISNKEGSRRTLETFDEILNHIKEGEKWSHA